MRSVPGFVCGIPPTQYPAEGAALLAPVCSRVHGPPVMCDWMGIPSAFHSLPDCAHAAGAIRASIATTETDTAIDNTRDFTSISLFAAFRKPRWIPPTEEVAPLLRQGLKSFFGPRSLTPLHRKMRSHLYLLGPAQPRGKR